MIDKRVGNRIKKQREKLGLTQEQFAEKLGFSTNYISTIERGASFPRYDKLIVILNGLETSADAIFCDVLEHATTYQASEISKALEKLSPAEQKRILQVTEFMVKQAMENND